jgi:hypothetical protein
MRTAAVLCLSLLFARALHAAPVAIEPADQPIVDAFVGHARAMAQGFTVEKLKAIDTPETFCWVQMPQLECSLTAYELTGDVGHLRDFVSGFEKLRSLLVPDPAGLPGWRGKPIPPLRDPAKPDAVVNEIQTDFRAAGVLARFASIVEKDAALSAEFAETRRTYLQLARDFVKRWESSYEPLPNGAGVYRWNLAYTPERAGISLAYEKQSMVVEGLINLWHATGDTAYRDRAAALGTRFKQNLREVDGLYQWHYWDPAGPWDLKPDGKPKHWIGAEPKAEWHAVTVGMAVLLHRNGLVFDDADIRRFVRTQLEVCWNGDAAAPQFKLNNGSPADPKEPILAPALAPWDAKLREFVYGPVGQADRIAGKASDWKGGVLASRWLRGKYLTPAPAGK